MLKFCVPMIQFPDIDPVAFSIGPVAVHWYGLAYLAGIGLGWWLLHRRAARGAIGWTTDEVSDCVFYAAVGAVLGGRIGYAVFYNFADYLANPLNIFAVWRGGMSFHGGVIGFVLALLLLSRRHNRPFFAVTDFIVPVVPIGLFFGRIANFVNQELWGAPTGLPWGVVFTHPVAGPIARHPSQLYEALLEGVLLFVILRVVAARTAATGVVSATFLLGYGIMRFLVEFVREPDPHIGYLTGNWFTMGQLLSLPMIIAGIVLLMLRNPARNSLKEA